jgi:hypothetical protein
MHINFTKKDLEAKNLLSKGVVSRKTDEPQIALPDI